jgi:hypothetical protein
MPSLRAQRAPLLFCLCVIVDLVFFFFCSLTLNPKKFSAFSVFKEEEKNSKTITYDLLRLASGANIHGCVRARSYFSLRVFAEQLCIPVSADFFSFCFCVASTLFVTAMPLDVLFAVLSFSGLFSFLVRVLIAWNLRRSV